jgi:peptidoglycan hydrolase-like protein with peptidoglycan-binding domain
VATITQPVGKGASNTNHGEVLLVQQLINKHRGTQAPIGEDGVVGPQTIGAIEEFQRRVVRMSYPDGRVDPGGKTIRALSEPGAGPVPPSPPPGPARGTITVSFSHRSKLPTGVTGLPGSTDKTTNTRYESIVTVSGGGISGSFRGSIFPDNMNVKGRIKDGTYDLSLGFHKPGTPKQEDLVVRTNGCRAALVVNSNGSVPVISNDRTKQTSSAIHVHNGYNTWVASTPMSEGCQILHPADWPAFIKLFIAAYPNVSDWLAPNGDRIGKKIGTLKVGA